MAANQQRKKKEKPLSLLEGLCETCAGAAACQDRSKHADVGVSIAGCILWEDPEDAGPVMEEGL